MKCCPITYEEIGNGDRYSRNGLRLLSRRLKDLEPLPLTAQEQRQEAGARADKMSIQGLQPKLSAALRINEGRFDIVDTGGKFILKPQCDFEEIPQNEALTMTLASMVGIEVPPHGLLYSKDNSWTYFIKRFDRIGRKDKLPLEDFAQLSGQSRETKYNSSTEQVAKVISKYCTFPLIQHTELLKRLLFCFLTGNEDMHLKNFSLICREGKVELSPAYDLVNSTIALPRAHEELALPLNGKKSKLTSSDLVDYFGRKYLGLNDDVIDDVFKLLASAVPHWKKLIRVSFLSESMKQRYEDILEQRRLVLGIP
jgi:serine/threonine-protein kinase HipA